MNKKFNSEYRGLSKSEKIYDYEDGKLFREIEINFDDDGYDYSIQKGEYLKQMLSLFTFIFKEDYYEWKIL